MAQKYEVDGLICGHTHIPALKAMREITYGNAGSWVGTHHTALVEKRDGVLDLIKWPASHGAQPHLYDPFYPHHCGFYKVVPDAYRYRPLTYRLVQRIQTLWPVTEEVETLPQERPALAYFLHKGRGKLRNLLHNSISMPEIDENRLEKQSETV